jgi:hypothetical protein
VNRFCVVLVSLAVILLACTATTGGADTGAPSEAAVPSTAAAAPPVAVSSLIASAIPETTAPASAPSPSASESGAPVDAGASATPGPIDPCTLLTASEASKVMGTKLSGGVSAVMSPDRVCTFKGSGKTELKVILAPPAPDAATAKGYWDAARAQVPADLPVKDLSAFDRSAFGSGSLGGLSLSALFVLDGNHFFEVYCGFPACSQSASLGAADHIAGRLP